MTEQTTGTAKMDQASETGTLRLSKMSVALTVGDVERSLRFYVEALGFGVQERWEEDGKLLGAMLTAGECRLGLSQDDWKKGRDREKGVGSRIYAETAQDLDAIARRAREHGGEAEGPQEQWGTQALTLTDPDGFKLTITAGSPSV